MANRALPGFSRPLDSPPEVATARSVLGVANRPRIVPVAVLRTDLPCSVPDGEVHRILPGFLDPSENGRALLPMLREDAMVLCHFPSAPAVTPRRHLHVVSSSAHRNSSLYERLVRLLNRDRRPRNRSVQLLNRSAHR